MNKSQKLLKVADCVCVCFFVWRKIQFNSFSQQKLIRSEFSILIYEIIALTEFLISILYCDY